MDSDNFMPFHQPCDLATTTTSSSLIIYIENKFESSGVSTMMISLIGTFLIFKTCSGLILTPTY